MGKYVLRKDYGLRTGEVAAVVMDRTSTPPSSSSTGVRTRAKTLALQLENCGSVSESTSYSQLRSRMFEKVSVGKRKLSSVGTNPSRRSTAEVVEMVGSGAENEVAAEVSSGEGVVEINREGYEVAGTLDVGSTTPPRNLSIACRRTRATPSRNAPSTHELEEFFSGAEQRQQKFFLEKYNFDVVNDCPLPGRYEWVRSV